MEFRVLLVYRVVWVHREFRVQPARFRGHKVSKDKGEIKVFKDLLVHRETKEFRVSVDLLEVLDLLGMMVEEVFKELLVRRDRLEYKDNRAYRVLLVHKVLLDLKVFKVYKAEMVLVHREFKVLQDLDRREFKDL